MRKPSQPSSPDPSSPIEILEDRIAPAGVVTVAYNPATGESVKYSGATGSDDFTTDAAKLTTSGSISFVSGDRENSNVLIGATGSTRVQFLAALTIDGGVGTNTGNDYATKNTIIGTPTITNFSAVLVTPWSAWGASRQDGRR